MTFAAVASSRPFLPDEASPGVETRTELTCTEGTPSDVDMPFLPFFFPLLLMDMDDAWS